MNLKLKEDCKLASIQVKYKKHCKNCGHTLSFYAFEPNRKLCKWCGVYNYRNELSEFKDLMLKKKRKGKNEK